LVLGGTHHVGRAFVETLLASGTEVTTLTSGRSGPPKAGAAARYADRFDPAAVAAALGEDTWDAVVDTWSGHPAAISTTARLLSGRAAHYTYISSRSVYRWPIPSGADESAPLVDADPASIDDGDYAAVKRGGELAAESFAGPVLLARAGLILGPWEVVGRLPFWLTRIAAGGRVPAPGPRDRPLQYIDARDIAVWVRGAAATGVAGAFNTVSRPGHTTIGALLDTANGVTGGRSELVWLTPETVERAGVEPWTELPIWVPPTGELAALHDGDTRSAQAAGLVCRPMEETVADTWSWLEEEGAPPPPAARGATGLDAEAERRLWEAQAHTG
jgi:nucleoside-diphosphate-sugar epimerase